MMIQSDCRATNGGMFQGLSEILIQLTNASHRYYNRDSMQSVQTGWGKGDY